ncbi:TRAP-type mannitol/chloroaromatic compound transport system, substrate-binding protein [Ferrimonas sediminum]|uniref:TRAP-type mannitol/chloroaromatic compound transport system, substrate-binding protein n=1 Tax=Ferrimonas sediminum TaxID=718193 RepID=A0A1G8LS25_9GAMM|nr:TRAP transporter substrate-binding protein DctP [Ferrimonas sediminum]SDI58531.1 TRAP-type mannitol/chloroaromatic compound transport system, substrate-binding protein [Ferrimonas sediminum]
MRVLVTALLTLALLGCSKPQDQEVAAQPQQLHQWKLVTSWPKNFPGLGMAPERFAERVNQMSNGRLTITVYGAGDLLPAFEVFDAVSQGTAEMGHSAAYYWKGKVPAAQFFSTLPFGMNAQEMNSWLSYGGGMALWHEVYAPFGIKPLAGGNTGVQMGGWFNKEINSLEDFKGLKMRLPGLGGEVLARLGGVPVTLPGRELFTALQTGAIDATEWVGPYNDLAFGLHKAATYYYYPGWHEPGTTLEFIVNQKAYDALPADLQAIVVSASQAVNQDMLDEYTMRNIDALHALVQDHGVQLRRFPDDVLEALRLASAQVVAEQAASDAQMKKVYDSYRNFYQGVRRYHKISEEAYNQARGPIEQD